MIVHLVDGRVKGFASRGCRGTHTGMFYVYLLHSTKDNWFYIGFSTDLKRRLSEHTRGASFATKSRGPWKLIYYETLQGTRRRGRPREIPEERGRAAFPARAVTSLPDTISRPRTCLDSNHVSER